MSKDVSTEERIKQAAKKVFLEKGMNGARMQDIADEAQINKAMLHYYFRSKQKLFDIIFEEQLNKMMNLIMSTFLSDLKFEDKIRYLVKNQIDIISDTPTLPIFIISEVTKNPNILEEKLKDKPILAFIQTLRKMLKAEAKAGHIKPIKAEHFLLDIMSMVIYPVMAAPMVKTIFKTNDKQYQKIIEERKTHIADLMIEYLRKTGDRKQEKNK